MIRALTICALIFALTSCSIFSAPKTLQAIDDTGFIILSSCVKFKQDQVDVYYKRYKPGRGVYKGDLAFSFRPDELIKVNAADDCNIFNYVLIEDVLNNPVADTGRFKVQISLKLVSEIGTFIGQGESQFYNSFGDISGNKTQQARKKALEAAIKDAITGLEQN